MTNIPLSNSKRLLLGLTGSVAAYKAVDLVRLLQKKSYEVSVILTKAAQEFVTPLLVSSIAKNKIYTELFSSDDVDGMTHIKLSRDNDLILVAPASADFIAKMANSWRTIALRVSLIPRSSPHVRRPSRQPRFA